jgi:NADPH:quinone reductase-like Zn-dependent oxidoreductase
MEELRSGSARVQWRAGLSASAETFAREVRHIGYQYGRSLNAPPLALSAADLISENTMLAPLAHEHATTTMRAIIQEGYGSPDVLHLREVDRPALTANGVLVRVRAASVNALDYHLIHMSPVGRLFFGLRKPKAPVRGADFAGTVESVGEGVTRFKPGDDVFGVAGGTFAEYAVAREDRLMAKPARLTFAQAAAIPVAGFTALQGLRDSALVKPGDRVMIYGAGGGVGTFAVQIARALGAHVTAVTSARNLAIIRGIGADEIIDYTNDDFASSGKRYDVFVDIAANRPVTECLGVLEPKGTYVAVGAAKGNLLHIVGHLLTVLALSRFRSQRVVLCSAKSNHEDLVALAELVESGKLVPAIDREYSLAEVPEAIRYAKSGAARAKIVINVS